MKNTIYIFYIIYIACGVGLVMIVSALLDFFKSGAEEKKPEQNIIGIGKANGIYFIKTNDVYIVAGKKIKDKKKAVRELMDLIKENGLTPPDTYFRTIRMDNRK